LEFGCLVNNTGQLFYLPADLVEEAANMLPPEDFSWSLDAATLVKDFPPKTVPE
jgi:hypothetical protein